MNRISIFFKTISEKKSFPAIIAGLFAFILYLVSMPVTVQEGDTAELVLAGVNFSLVHPPGYPLQVIYNFVVTKLLFFLSPYQASSLGSIILASISAYLIALWSTGWRGFLIATLWSTSFLAWKWAILPDVFSGFILFSIMFLYLLKRKDLITSHYPFWLALSVLHQQLIIFLLPVLIYSWWPYRNNSKNNLHILVYGIIALSGYFILLLVDDKKPGSWGVVENLSDLWKHFTRHDYGTTSLSAHQREIPFQHNVYYFSIRFIESFWSVLLIAFISWRASAYRITKEFLLILSIVSAYFVIVILRSSLNIDAFGISTLERFFLFPFLLILFTVFLNEKTNVNKKIISALLVLNVVSNFLFFSKINFYRTDTKVRDWAISLLQQTPPNAILWVSGDTEINATRYLQEVDGQRKDLLLMSSLDLAEKDFDKVVKNYPTYFKQGKTWHERIAWQSVEFYSNDLSIPGSSSFDKNVLGLVARYTPGTGTIAFNCLDKKYYSTNISSDDYLSRPDIRSALRFSYGNCHLNAAHQIMRNKDWKAIQSLTLAGLDIVSPHPLLQLQLCLSLKLAGEDATECEEIAAEAFANTDSSYLPKELNLK